MIKNKSLQIALAMIIVLLLAFQVLLVTVAVPRDYYLIHDWIFFAINYVIILLFLCLFSGKNLYIKWIKFMIGLILLTVNTTFFYYIGDTNVVVSKSTGNQHELILKEYKKMNYESVQLKRRGFLFGRKVDTLMGSSTYKAIEKGTYKIQWISGDIAVLHYQVSSTRPALYQKAFSYRASNYARHQYVAPSLNGKWIDKEDPGNYLLYDQGEIVYSDNGQLFYYRTVKDTKQYGIFSLAVSGDEQRPSFMIVLNKDAAFGDDDLLVDGSTITISPATLKETKYKVYSRE